jgi:hypothetical protein
MRAFCSLYPPFYIMVRTCTCFIGWRLFIIFVVTIGREHVISFKFNVILLCAPSSSVFKHPCSNHHIVKERNKRKEKIQDKSFKYESPRVQRKSISRFSSPRLSFKPPPSTRKSFKPYRLRPQKSAVQEEDVTYNNRPRHPELKVTNKMKIHPPNHPHGNGIRHCWRSRAAAAISKHLRRHQKTSQREECSQIRCHLTGCSYHVPRSSSLWQNI